MTKDLPRKTRRRIRLIEQQGGVCALCGEPFENIRGRRPSVDHIVPRSLGGRAGVSNWQVAHTSCNQRRNAMTIEEFRARWIKLAATEKAAP